MKLSQNSDKIAKAIEQRCRPDLDKLVTRTNTPRERWTGMAVLVAEDWDWVHRDEWERHKKGLRTRSKAAKHLETQIDILGTMARARGFVDVADAVEGHLKPLAETSLKKQKDEIGQILRKNGRNHKYTLIVLLGSMLNEQFDCWKELAHVIQEAYRAAGREEQADKITTDILTKIFKRNTAAQNKTLRRIRAKIRTEQELLTLRQETAKTCQPQ